MPSMKKSRKAGLPPGTMVYIGEERKEGAKASVEVIRYCKEKADAVTYADTAGYAKDAEEGCIEWIDFAGLNDVAAIEEAGRTLGLHPLTLEDIVDTEHSPKMEEFGDYLFIVIKDISFDEKTLAVKFSHICMVVGRNRVVTFTDGGNIFGAVKERIKADRGLVRKLGADYLAHALMDSVVDGYFLVMEKMGECIDALEDESMRPAKDTLRRIHRLKSGIVAARKNIWPVRDVAARIERGESGFFSPDTRIYARDVHDHVIHSLETLDSYRETLTGIVDVYLITISNRMNDVMKTLAVIATIFMPLTFIAGVYGMNFENMPELGWDNGYYYALGLMLLVGVVMAVWFKKKRWM